MHPVHQTHVPSGLLISFVSAGMFSDNVYCKTMMSNSCVYDAGNLQEGVVMVEKRSKAFINFMK